MFGIPVQLTFNGRTHYGTPCGGVMSILIMLVFSIGGLSRLYKLWANPVYQQYPISYNYEFRNVTIPDDQGTIAVGVLARSLSDITGNSTDSLVRVQFIAYLNSTFDYQENNYTYLDAVYCDELYAD